jgi:thiol peroxidase
VFGVGLNEGAFAELLARAVVVVDENGIVIHTELVSDIANAPNYDAAINALK